VLLAIAVSISPGSLMQVRCSLCSNLCTNMERRCTLRNNNRTSNNSAPSYKRRVPSAGPVCSLTNRKPAWEVREQHSSTGCTHTKTGSKLVLRVGAQTQLARSSTRGSGSPCFGTTEVDGVDLTADQRWVDPTGPYRQSRAQGDLLAKIGACCCNLGD
jgi:hypothetical protein